MTLTLGANGMANERYDERATGLQVEGSGAALVEVDAQDLQDLRGQVAAIRRTQAVIEFQLDGTIVTANENFLQAIGYALDEIQGRHHRMFVDPAEAATPAYERFWAELRAGKSQTAEYSVWPRAAAKSGSSPPTTPFWTPTAGP
ncbi:MAG: PAS domain-containing protein [Vicinamibacterales bacterium]